MSAESPTTVLDHALDGKEAGAQDKAKESVEALSKKDHLTCLPTEILIHLMKFLEPAASACLGVTSKLLYPIHRELLGTVSLEKQQQFDLRLLDLDGSGRPWGHVSLSTCLAPWMPEELGYHWRLRKFRPIHRFVPVTWLSERLWREAQERKEQARKDLVRYWAAERL